MIETNTTFPGIEILAVSPKIAKLMLGCGTTRLYELLNRGELQSYRDGKSRKIVVASLRDFVGRQLLADQTEGGSRWTAHATRARRLKRDAHGDAT